MSDIETIGIGVPGAVDSVHGVVVYCSNIKFRNTPLAEMVKERTGKPVFVQNDANAAAYGEVIAGAAKGCKDVVVITPGHRRGRRRDYQWKNLFGLQQLRRRVRPHGHCV